MATIGGVLNVLDRPTQVLIDRFLELFPPVRGEVEETPIAGGVIVTGEGGRKEGTGAIEEITIFISQSSTPEEFAISTVDGEINVTVPGGIDIALVTPGTVLNADQVARYLEELVNDVLPAPSPYKDNLLQAIQALHIALDGREVVLQYVTPGDDITRGSHVAGGGDVLRFDASSAQKETLMVFNLLELDTGAVELKGVAGATFVGEGEVRIESDRGVIAVGDLFDQRITTGAGADTLIGGGGNDTLVGGAGSDIFVFNNLGHYRVEDFDKSVGDVLVFDIQGIEDLGDLIPFVKSLEQGAEGVKVEFYDGVDKSVTIASITLVGVTLDELSADMVKFSW